MSQQIDIESIWWRNVQPGEFYNIEMIILNAYPMSIGSLRIAKETKARVHLLASS